MSGRVDLSACACLSRASSPSHQPPQSPGSISRLLYRPVAATIRCSPPPLGAPASSLATNCLARSHFLFAARQQSNFPTLPSIPSTYIHPLSSVGGVSIFINTPTNLVVSLFTDRRFSPGLTINPGTNNPFRRGPNSPALSPPPRPDSARQRPPSRNPFLDNSDSMASEPANGTLPAAAQADKLFVRRKLPFTFYWHLTFGTERSQHQRNGVSKW